MDRTEPHEDAERLHAVHHTGEHGADRDAGGDLIARRGVFRREREPDTMLRGVDAHHHHGDLGAGGRGLAHRALAAPRNLAHVQQTVHARQQLDEDAELREAEHPAAHDLALA